MKRFFAPAVSSSSGSAARPATTAAPSSSGNAAQLAATAENDSSKRGYCVFGFDAGKLLRAKESPVSYTHLTLPTNREV